MQKSPFFKEKNVKTARLITAAKTASPRPPYCPLLGAISSIVRGIVAKRSNKRPGFHRARAKHLQSNFHSSLQALYQLALCKTIFPPRKGADNVDHQARRKFETSLVIIRETLGVFV